MLNGLKLDLYKMSNKQTKSVLFRKILHY